MYVKYYWISETNEYVCTVRIFYNLSPALIAKNHFLCTLTGNPMCPRGRWTCTGKSHKRGWHWLTTLLTYWPPLSSIVISISYRLITVLSNFIGPTDRIIIKRIVFDRVYRSDVHVLSHSTVSWLLSNSPRVERKNESGLTVIRPRTVWPPSFNVSFTGLQLSGAFFGTLSSRQICVNRL